MATYLCQTNQKYSVLKYLFENHFIFKPAAADGEKVKNKFKLPRTLEIMSKKRLVEFKTLHELEKIKNIEF